MSTSLVSAPSPALLSPVEILRGRIDDRTAKVGVIGLGYVGLPLAVELGGAGYSVVGLDQNATKVSKINAGQSYIPDVAENRLRSLVESRKLRASVDTTVLSQCDAISICVPTPLLKTKDPDLSYIVDAAETVAANLKPGTLIILESTTYPGTTEEAVLPILESTGLRVGEDFFLCFSPERVDPANPNFGTGDIPKVIGGVTPLCTELATALYSQVMKQIVPVSSTQVAEMVKLLENTFRMINIGLANEMAIMCERMGIDVWEVIDAAATKPFGFMPFYPGPGLGGHCIPIDPHYLAWKTRLLGYESRFVQLASDINSHMPEFVVRRITAELNRRSKPVNGSRIHIVGVAYKPNVSDVRESPAVDVIALLQRLGADVTYNDPYVERIVLDSGVLERSESDEAFIKADCVVIITDHAVVDHVVIANNASLVVDTRNALRNVDGDHICRL